MKPVICIINYDDNSIQLYNGDTLPIDDCISNDDNADELYIRDDLHYAYFEDKDNSDEYDTDDANRRQANKTPASVVILS